VTGDLLYLDLDTSVVGPIDDFAKVRRPGIMADVYRRGGLQSSVMFLPASIRPSVWRRWIAAPDRHMRIHRRGGDQAFLERVLPEHGVIRWQEALPGRLASFKAEVRDQGLKPSVGLVVFHG